MSSIADLRTIATAEYTDIVASVETQAINKLRIALKEGSLIDIWFSQRHADRYSYHWERTAVEETIYRHDNAPHEQWQIVHTFPKHFHDGSEQNVTESHISDVPTEALREFLNFARRLITEEVDDGNAEPSS